MPVEFAYAQARAQARHGARPGAETWSLLESSVGLAQFLHLVRGTALSRRVEHFSAATSPHTIESSLRRDWHREVESATRWVPLRWRAAVAWTGRLAELPALSYLLDGGASLPWMAEDPVLSGLGPGAAEAPRRPVEGTPPGDGAAPARAAPANLAGGVPVPDRPFVLPPATGLAGRPGPLRRHSADGQVQPHEPGERL